MCDCVTAQDADNPAAWKMHTVYSASKAAIESFTRTWALELGHEYGVTVNCINPGPVATEMWE